MKMMKAALPAAMLLGSIFAGTGHAADIVVLRGSASETVSTSPAGPLPTVLRGNTAVTEEKETPRDHTVIDRQLVAGQTLWVVDGAGRRLQACNLRGTGYTGRSRIHCIGGR